MPTALLVHHVACTEAHFTERGPGQRAPSHSAPHKLYSEKGFVHGMTTTSTLVLQSLQAPLRPLADGGTGFCSMRAPVLPASQDKRWSSVWEEGKDGAGTVTLLEERFSSLMFVVPLICFYLLATAAYQYIQFPYRIFCHVV